MLSIIQAAGWPIWPLILCSIVGLALVIERSVTLRRGRVAPDKLLDEVVSLHDHLTLTEVNIILDKDRAAQFGIRHYCAIGLNAKDLPSHSSLRVQAPGSMCKADVPPLLSSGRV